MGLNRPLALVSGGPDSVALLRVLIELGHEPAVLHVDHGLRGEESAADAEFVRRLCGRLGVRCEVRRLGLAEGPNLQERARDERYRLAREVSGAVGARAVVAGHTADDVAETVLLNLSRGAGLRGLSGIPPVSGLVCRPLIERSRREVLRYLEYLGQDYRVDPTNLAAKYARNRVRLQVLPALEEIHPGAARNLARAASLAREDLEVLEELAAEIVERRGDEVVLRSVQAGTDAARAAAARGTSSLLHPAPRRAARVRVRRGRTGAGRGGEGTRTLDLPGGVVAAARPGELVFYDRPEPVGDAEVELPVGETVFAGWRVRVREVRGFDAADAARPGVAYLEGARGPFRVRLVQEGDMIRPLGLGGTKKVLRAMMDRGVPADLRRRTPVVVAPGGEVAWVFLGDLGEAFKVAERTERVLRVEVERIS